MVKLFCFLRYERFDILYPPEHILYYGVGLFTVCRANLSVGGLEG